MLGKAECGEYQSPSHPHVRKDEIVLRPPQSQTKSPQEAGFFNRKLMKQPCFASVWQL